MVLFVVTMAVFAIWAKVPFVPTPRRTVKVMLDEAQLKEGDTIYDLGAGDARMLIQAKRACPGIRAIGYEIVPFVWFLGKLRIWLSRTDVDLRWGNALKKDVRDADCIFLYLITELMPKFEEKFNKELKSGARVISHSFSFPGREPVKQLLAPGWLGQERVLVYEW